MSLEKPHKDIYTIRKTEQFINFNETIAKEKSDIDNRWEIVFCFQLFYRNKLKGHLHSKIAPNSEVYKVTPKFYTIFTG